MLEIILSNCGTCFENLHDHIRAVGVVAHVTNNSCSATTPCNVNITIYNWLVRRLSVANIRLLDFWLELL